MTKQEAKFERNLSDQIVREVARILGYKKPKFYDHADGPQKEPWITRIYGQRLTLPQDGWDVHFTVTFWQGKVNTDFGRGVWDKAIYQSTNDGEFSFDAADPNFMDHIAAKTREILALGKPDFE